ncbi:MAG: linear amide C-N hydrolase [Ignavibacteriaceae bacterium]|jgi:predicted choloylglycine hydrolase
MKKITIFITSLLFLILCLNCNENTTGPDSGSASLVVQGKVIPSGEIVQISDYPIFVMNYSGDYNFQNYLKTGISLNKFRLQDDSVLWGCTCFSAMADSCKIFGRNFDWYHHIALILYTHPPNAYSSISMADITYLGFSESSSLEQIKNSSSISGSPYVSMDGLNEKGVAIGQMLVPVVQPPYDPNKVNLGCLDIIRLVLDYAASTDEAVSLIQKFNFKDDEHPVHYLIADRNGESVVIEYVNKEMKVIHNNEPFQICTNFIITGSKAPSSTPCWRYNTAYNMLKNTNGETDGNNAMEILSSVSQSITMWSAVYDMNSFSLDICVDKKYNKTFSVKTIKKQEIQINNDY